MNKITNNTLLMLSSCLALTACNSDSDDVNVAPTAVLEVEQLAVQAQISDCAPDAGLNYLCGVLNVEDLLLLGDTGMILASGMSSEGVAGHLYLIDPLVNTAEDLIYDGSFTQEFDSVAFSQCPGVLNLDDFSAHGLALNEYDDNMFQLYITSHGEREAIEVFEIDMNGASTTFKWQGCITLPAEASFNSVAILNDGGFVTTKFIDENTGFEAVNNGEINGGVYEWHPGGRVNFVAGTELSGANGIALSADERYMYVAAFGARELVKFDRSVTPVSKEVVALDITLDNIRWGVDGKLLTAGNNYVAPEDCNGSDCNTGWSVLEIDADTLAVTRVGGANQDATMQGISSALEVNGTIWVGTYSGDRVASFTKQ